MSLRLVRKNFIWRIESIASSFRDELKPFNHIVRPDFDTSDSSGFIRMFSVDWLSSGPDTDLTSGEDRTAMHDFGITVYYGKSSRVDDLFDLVLSDRDDMIDALRIGSGDTRLGWCNEYPSVNIGLFSRDRVRDELEEDEEQNVFIYKSLWRCLIREEGF